MADNTSSRFSNVLVDLLWFVLIVALAAGVRIWYVQSCVAGGTLADPPFSVQERWPAAEIPAGEKLIGKANPTQLDQLVANLIAENQFKGAGPLAPKGANTGRAVEESTAHVAPGYPFLVSLVYRLEFLGQYLGEDWQPKIIRFAQCALGALTAGLMFFFTRRAFRSLTVALLAGLFCALHPFWVVNTGEIADGVVATFLMAAVLAFGTRSGEVGGAFSSLLFGLALAGLAMVRAALLPFTLIGLLWFLVKCRSAPRGWLCAILAVLGFANGIAAWTVYNYQRFQDFVPVADSAFVHLWMGNNKNATGGSLSEQELRAALPDPKPGKKSRLEKLLEEENQSKRYRMLSQDVVDFVKEKPVTTVRNRIYAGLFFVLGENWFDEKSPGMADNANENVPSWLAVEYPTILNSVLLAMVAFGLLGWRWTMLWGKHCGLAAVAMIMVPLPYLLTHAETLWGPRLPLDGILLAFSAFAIVYFLPGFRRGISRGPQRKKEIKEVRPQPRYG